MDRQMKRWSTCVSLFVQVTKLNNFLPEHIQSPFPALFLQLFKLMHYMHCSYDLLSLLYLQLQFQMIQLYMNIT